MVAEVAAHIRSSDATRIKVAVSDMDGILRGKFMHKDKFLAAIESGFGFCNVVFGWDCADVCYDNAAYTGWHTGYPDAKAFIDLNTFRTVPWENDVGMCLADFRATDHTSNGLEICPRGVLKKVLQRAHHAGYEPWCGLEFEWFNFQESSQSIHEKNFSNLTPLTPGMFGYSLLRASQNSDYFCALFEQLNDFKIPLEGLHTETGPGAFEAAIVASDALEAADRGVLLKSAIKEISMQHGVMASFMAKIDAKLPGCSGHIHQSLRQLDSGENIFYDQHDKSCMSSTFQHYLAGQMQLLPELLVMLAPTVNSYKRLVEGMWAPTQVTWGIDNRTTALRVIPGSAASCRLETRIGGADLNPYLALSALIAAGLYGIEHQLKLPSAPVSGNGYAPQADAVRLPSNLAQATDLFSESTIAKEVFGEAFVKHFAATRRWEWQQYERSVTQWERQRYFEII